MICVVFCLENPVSLTNVPKQQASPGRRKKIVNISHEKFDGVESSEIIHSDTRMPLMHSNITHRYTLAVELRGASSSGRSRVKNGNSLPSTTADRAENG